MLNPKVSVIVPAYNAGSWIKESLKSILQQSWQNIELIVVNDGSTDNTEEIIAEFKDERLRYFKQDNRGQAAACNLGLAKASGDYIKFFDADDLMSSDHLAQQLQRLGSSTSAVASCAWGKFFDGDPASAKFIPESVWKDMVPLDWLKAALTQQRDMMGACLWLIPRQVIEKAGGWDERLSLNNDFEFSIRLLMHSEKVLFTPEARLYYRSGIPASLSKTISRQSVEAVMLSTKLGCSYLLKADNSAEMKKICANRYQDWIYQFYPRHADLLHKMEKEIDLLGGSDIAVQGGRFFMQLKRVLGWKLAKQVQMVFYRMGYLKLLKK